MDGNQFVFDLRALNALWIKALLKQMASPEGRQPPEEELLLSEWYKRQTAEDQQRVALALERATEGTLLTVLSVLDGIITLPSAAENGRLELNYLEDGRRDQLNDSEGGYLSDLLYVEVRK